MISRRAGAGYASTDSVQQQKQQQVQSLQGQVTAAPAAPVVPGHMYTKTDKNAARCAMSLQRNTML